MLKKAFPSLLPLTLCVFLFTTPVLRADQNAEVAIWLLKRATTPQRNGMHNVQLRALRQMKDPQLKPLFEELASRPELSVRIHGALGLAELSEPRELEHRYILAMKNPRSQFQLIQAGIDADLISVASAKSLVDSRQVGQRSQLALMAYLVAQGEAVDLTKMLAATKLEEESDAMLAWLLLLESGHQGALNQLKQMDRMNALTRDQVLRHLMTKIIKYRYDGVTGFTTHFLNGVEKESPSLQLLIFQAAAQTPTELLDRKYYQQVSSSNSLSQQVLLALLAMENPKAFSSRTLKRLGEQDNPLVASLFLIASQLSQETDSKLLSSVPKAQVAELDAWLIQWANQHKNEKANTLMRALYAEQIKRRKMTSAHVQNLVFVAQYLMEHDPEAAVFMAQGFTALDALKQEAILMGLIRSRSAQAGKLVDQVQTYKSHSGMSMAALIHARHAERLKPEMMKELILVVRGGAELRLPLRVQAAWIYLKLQGQAKVALKATIEGP